MAGGDSTAIATALAARFAAAAMTAPAGYAAVRLSTYQPAEDVPPLPAVLVFAPASGDFETGTGTRKGVHDWIVRFLFDEAGDLARQSAALIKWLDVFAGQLRGAVQLGGVVDRCVLVRYSIGFFEYAGKSYAGIEGTVRITTTEPWLAIS